MTPLTRVLASAAAAAVLLTGCGDGPMLAGAAATVGDTRITTGALEDIITRGLADESAQQNVGADRTTFTRTVLRRLIDHELLTRTAARHGVSITAGDALQSREQIEAQVGGPSALETEARKAGLVGEDLEQTISDVALRDALADKLTAGIEIPQQALVEAYQQNIAQFDRVRSSHILVANPALAQSILAQVRARPTEFAALAKKHSTDPGSKDNGGDLGFQGRGALTKAFEDAIFTNRPGSFVSVKTEFGYHVIHVVERQTTSLQAATKSLRRTLLGQQRQQAVSEEMHVTARQAEVRVNPRFGVWDFGQLDILPAPQDKTSVTKPSPRPSDVPPAPPALGTP